MNSSLTNSFFFWNKGTKYSTQKDLCIQYLTNKAAEKQINLSGCFINPILNILKRSERTQNHCFLKEKLPINTRFVDSLLTSNSPFQFLIFGNTTNCSNSPFFKRKNLVKRTLNLLGQVKYLNFTNSLCTYIHPYSALKAISLYL